MEKLDYEVLLWDIVGRVVIVYTGAFVAVYHVCSPLPPLCENLIEKELFMKISIFYKHCIFLP